MARKRQSPRGLSEKANKVWRSTLEDFDLSEHEYPILEGACRELDLITELEKELKGAPLMVRGSMGQDVANPLLAEVRQHRAAYVGLIRSLKLPEGESSVGQTPASRSAQNAANARWSRGA